MKKCSKCSTLYPDTEDHCPKCGFLPNPGQMPTPPSDIPPKDDKTRKILIAFIIIVVAILAFLVGYWVITEKNHNKKIESEQEEEISLTEVIEKQKEKERQDSIERMRVRVTPDLALFDLHGPVSSVTVASNINEYETMVDMPYNFFSINPTLMFTPEGDFTNFKKFLDFSSYIKVKRNGGYVTTIEFDSDYPDLNYKVKWDGNKISKIALNGYEEYQEIKYSYNDNQIVSGKFELSHLSGYIKGTITFNYQNFDQFDNWTSRTCNVSGIENYDENERKISYSYTETRSIAYY